MAITISGQNNNDKILASDGVLDQISGFNVVGVLTATTFETTAFNANHINVGSTIQLGNAGIITATTLIGNVTGNVNSTSNLLLQISGSEKFRVGNGGQFGIAGANYGTAGQVFTSGGSGSAPTWSTINSDKITEGNTEAEVVDTGSDGHFKVTTEGSERLRIESSGRLLIANISSRSVANVTAKVQLEGTSADGSAISITRNSDSVSPPYLNFGKSRATSTGGTTIIQNGDNLGEIRFSGADGNDLTNHAASINAEIDGAPSNNVTPGRLILSTTSSTGSDATERLRIDSSGRVLIGSTAKAGDSALQVYTSDRLHPAIRVHSDNANGYTILSDAYTADESNVNFGISYSSASLVISRGVKVSGTADNTYLSSQDSYATRPCAIKMDDDGAFNFLTTETDATTTTDSAVSLTKVFTIDRVGNIYQRISARNMYFGASNQLRIGVQGNGDSNIEAVSGDLKIMDGGSVITQVRSDGLENFQHVYPANDNSKDLGTTAKRWRNLYVNDLQLSNKAKKDEGGNDVDGTWGDWTLQEGENDIFMINRRNGKKFKINMTEVS